MNSLGAGLLVGVAFTIIIPEGLEQDAQAVHYLGVTLSAGFVLMLLTDQVHHNHNEQDSKANEVTLGLIVHGIADGIALGSASISSQVKQQLQLVVFSAIMMHKLPATLGFSTYLIHSGLTIKKARSKLLMFTISSPLSSIFTYVLLYGIKINQNIQEDDKQVKSQLFEAICLLFSAGTFIYVSTLHILPEIMNSSKSKNRRIIVPLVIGIFLPLLLELFEG